MTDTEMEVILDMIDDIFQDQIKEGHHPITIASVGTFSFIQHSIDFAIASACPLSSAPTPG